MIGTKIGYRNLRNFLLQKIVLVNSSSRLGGFTIIESLAAIVIIAILLAAIAPVLSLSVATRVQSRRVELATQAARIYIDGVKTQTIPAPSSNSTTKKISEFDAPTPTGTLTCNANDYCTAPSGTNLSLYCIDSDGNGCQTSSSRDMLVQAFRYNPSTTANGYALGVRVYRADAFRGSATLLKNTPQPSFTGGIGRRSAPLVEMATEINDTIPKYSDLCARLSGCK